MAEQIVNHQCPNCSASLRFDGAIGKLKCDYCDSTFEPAEVEAAYREREERAAQAREAEAASWNTDGFSSDWGSDAQDMRSYNCPTCGAEMICDETTAATCCPYCGNRAVIPGQFSGALRPEFIIPFKTDKDAAVAALKEHYKGKTLLPKAFVSGNHIDEIQGVYVPFWLFDCDGDGHITYRAEKRFTEDTPRERIETTEHYYVTRNGSMHFDKLPVDASKNMPDDHMEAIEPFDYSGLQPFSASYMPGFLANKYDEEADVCGRRMEERCRKAVEEGIRETVREYDSVTEVEKTISVRKGSVHYAMLPVWMLSTNWNGKNFLFAMNGQSGKLVGDLPMDKGKFWGIFGGISVVLIGIMMALNFLSLHLDTLEMVLLCVLLPIIIALVVVLVMKGKLKSVRTGSARQYSSGLDLKYSDDRYIRTTVKRTPKNNPPPPPR